jgi:hypothetical protein
MTSIASRLTIVTTRSPLFKRGGMRLENHDFPKSGSRLFFPRRLYKPELIRICVIDLPDAAKMEGGRVLIKWLADSCPLNPQQRLKSGPCLRSHDGRYTAMPAIVEAVFSYRRSLRR